jgi:hypothetical protein
MSQPSKPGNAPDSTPEIISGSDQAANEAVKPADRTPSAGQAPPASVPSPPAPADRPVASAEDSDEAAELEAKLAAVRARASGQDTVKMKVEGEHSALIHNGIWVGDDWTEVPEHAVAGLMEAAANSGVKLTQEES